MPSSRGSRVVPAQKMAAALADAGMVFEGVPEVVDLKREVLAAASKCVGPDVIIASTTSTILVDDLSGAVEHPAALSQRALAQPGLSDPAGRDLAGRGDRSRRHRAGQGPARRHRQDAGGVRGHAGLHRAAHPGAGHERGGADGGGRRRQCRGYRQGDPLRFRLPLRGDGPAGIHRLGRRRHSVLRQPLSRRRARQRPLPRARGDLRQHARRPHRHAHRRRLPRLYRPATSMPIASSGWRNWSSCCGISGWRGRRCWMGSRPRRVLRFTSPLVGEVGSHR